MDKWTVSPFPAPHLRQRNALKPTQRSRPVHCMQTLDGIPKLHVSGGGSRHLPHNGRLQELLSDASSTMGDTLGRWVFCAAGACLQCCWENCHKSFSHCYHAAVVQAARGPHCCQGAAARPAAPCPQRSCRHQAAPAAAQGALAAGTPGQWTHPPTRATANRHPFDYSIHQTVFVSHSGLGCIYMHYFDTK